MTSFLKELANETSATALADAPHPGSASASAAVPVSAPAPAKMAVEHLNLFYGDFQGLRDINLTFPENQVTALIGPSGCGKSTLLSVLAGLETLTGGEVTVDGETLRGPSPKVGFMPQQDQLFPWRSIWDNVTLALAVRGENTPENQARVRSLLERYGLWAFRDKRPGQLSGGMRQRCALIRTLAADPRILLLDEPTSYLDMGFKLIGEGFVLIAQLSYGISTVLINLFSRKVSPVVLSGTQFAMGGIVLTLIGLGMGGHLENVTTGGVVIIFYLAMVSAVAYTLWSVLLAWNDVSKVAIFGFVNPLCGVILSALILGEVKQAFNVGSLAALILVCAGIYIVNCKENKRE